MLRHILRIITMSLFIRAKDGAMRFLINCAANKHGFPEIEKPSEIRILVRSTERKK